MRFILLFFVWCLLFVLAWPVAVLALFLWPLAWLVALPFRLVGAVLESIFALFKAVLMLPARLLGHRG